MDRTSLQNAVIYCRHPKIALLTSLGANRSRRVDLGERGEAARSWVLGIPLGLDEVGEEDKVAESLFARVVERTRGEVTISPPDSTGVWTWFKGTGAPLPGRVCTSMARTSGGGRSTGGRGGRDTAAGRTRVGKPECASETRLVSCPERPTV